MINKNITKFFPGLCCTLIVISIMAGCSERIVNADQGNTLKIRINAKSASLGTIVLLDRFIMTVTGPGIERPVVVELELDDDAEFLTGKASVPAGHDRRFVVRAFNEAGIEIYRGEAVSDVKPDDVTEIIIYFYPQVPMLRLSPLYMDVPQNYRFALDVKAYNIPDLNTIDILINFSNFLMRPDTVIKDTGLSSDVVLTMLDVTADNDYAFRVSNRNQTGIIAADRDHATLATIIFTTYSSDSGVEITSLSIEPTYIMNTAGDSIPTADIYTDGSTIELYKPSYYLAAYWPMNENAGDTVYDMSGNYLHGVAHGTSFTEGVYGMARFFDGIDDYVEVPDDSLLDIDEEITISLWARIDDSEIEGTLLSKRVPDGNINYQIRFAGSATSANDILEFQFGSPPGNAFRTTAILRDSEWHHIALSFVFSDTSSAQWVIDGQAVEGSWDVSDEILIPEVNAHHLQIGRELSASPNYFHGELDDILIFEIALEAPYLQGFYYGYMNKTGGN